MHLVLGDEVGELRPFSNTGRKPVVAILKGGPPGPRFAAIRKPLEDEDLTVLAGVNFAESAHAIEPVARPPKRPPAFGFRIPAGQNAQHFRMNASPAPNGGQFS